MRFSAFCLFAYLSFVGAAADCDEEKKQLAAVQKDLASTKSKSSAAAAQEKKLQDELASAKSKLDAAVKETEKARRSVADLEATLKTEKSKNAAETAKLSEQVKSLKAAEQTASASLKAEKARAGKLADELKVSTATVVEKEHSVTGLLSTMGSVSAGLHKTLLDQTTVDEKVLAAGSTAQKHWWSALDTIQKIDYNKHYKTHVAPQLDQINGVLYTNLQPHLDSIKATGAIDTAYSKYKDTKELVAPHVQKVGSMAYVHATGAMAAVPGVFSRIHVLIEELVDRIFKLFARVAPDQAKVLPSDFIDRLFMLLLSAALFFNFLVLVKWTWRVVKLLLRLKLFIVRIIIMPIYKLVKFTLGCACCMGTCCYCCGLCRKKKPTNGKATNGKATNGHATNGKATNGKEEAHAKASAKAQGKAKKK